MRLLCSDHLLINIQCKHDHRSLHNMLTYLLVYTRRILKTDQPACVCNKVFNCDVLMLRTLKGLNSAPVIINQSH